MKGATVAGHPEALIIRVSIHAPNEGSDHVIDPLVSAGTFVSIHAPNEGSDANKMGTTYNITVFQSTLPMKGATNKIGVIG